MAVWVVRYHPLADRELVALPSREQAAMIRAVEKLALFGPDLPFPYQSAVRGSAAGLRELRPRAGRSPWRALYRRLGNAFVIGAIGPEAEADPRGFTHALSVAEERIAEFEGGKTDEGQ